MHTYKFARTLLATSFCGWSLVACQGSGGTADLGKTMDMAKPADLLPQIPKGVYTLSNDVTDNQIMVYNRAANGSLTAGTPVSTGGRGLGGPLGDQGALFFDAKQNLFFAVNAGDNSISMLLLKTDGSLTLLFKVLSGGVKPVSITESNGVVYVVNAGDGFAAANIAGFQISGGTLAPIPNANKNLSIASADPAQISFTPDGSQLVVTEKMTNKIDTFSVASGVANGPMIQDSVGLKPFGFAFSATGKLIVSEATDGSASSYSIGPTGMLTPISSKVTSGQTAPCWVAVAGTTAYITNAGSNNISAYKVGSDGSLTLLAAGNSATTGMSPTDEAVTDAGDYLYVLNKGAHSFSIYSIASDGSLAPKTDLTFTGLPMYAVGLVAR